ncbi:MAG: hypothetical protein ACXWNW_15345 [Isosphaeraceae bacterium]
MNDVIGNKYGKQAERKILESAAPEMEGQTPRVCFRGQTGFSLWFFLLSILVPPLAIFLLLFVAPFIVRSRAVVVTDRHIYVFHTKGSTSRIKSKLATLDRPAEVKLTRFGLKVGDERKVYGPPGGSAAMNAAASLAQQPPA